MGSFAFLFTGNRICAKQEPERGCLKKIQHEPPKDCCPLLSLPPEIRAAIFKYLLDEVELTFNVTPGEEDNTTCYANHSQYRSNLSYLQVLRKFEAETLDLVRIQAARIVCEESLDNKRNGRLEGTTRYSRPISLPMQLNNMRPHLKHLTIDGSFSIKRLLDSDVFDSFPKLTTIRVATTLASRKCHSGYRESLNNPRTLDHLVQESLNPTAYRPRPVFRHGLPSQSFDNIDLEAILADSRLTRFRPIPIDITVKMQSSGCFDHDDDTFHEPVSRAVSAIRLTYEWPNKKVEKVEVDMYDQPMPLAVKSRWTEIVKLNPVVTAT